MPTASLQLTDTTYDSPSNNPFRVVMSELLSAFTVSAVTVQGDTAYLNYSYQTGNDYIFTFGSAVQVGEAGYVRIRVPATAATPNLDEDYDWTIYWGTDGVMHFGDTDVVRASRLTRTLDTVRWGSSRGTAGAVTAIQLEFSGETRLFVADDVTLRGDITSIGPLSAQTGFERYTGHVTLPADFGDGGSFTLQIEDLEAVYPGLAASEEWTLSWDADGNLSAIRTADIPIAITASLDRDYVAVGEEIILTLDYHKDGAAVSVDDISVIDGMTITAQPSTNNRQYRYTLTAPATGKGIGVVSIPADVIQPGNNAVSIQFTYIDSVTPTITLDAAGIEQGGVVQATIDFDYDVPIFESRFLDLGTSFNALGIGGVAIGIGGEALGIRSGANATAGEAEALDANHRRWVVPITAPVSGEGELEISLLQDAIGALSHEAVMAPLQYAPQNAPSIQLNILARDNFVLPVLFGEDLDHEIQITGNGPITVRVTGEIRPFYSDFDTTTGTLHILGRPADFYEDLEFTVEATDRDGTATKTGKLTVIQKPPEIKPPSKIQIALGHENSVIIPVENYPREGKAESDWINWDREVLPASGIRMFGDIPADANFPNKGNVRLTASNRGGDATPKTVPWEVTSPTRPQWEIIKVFPGNILDNVIYVPTNYSFRLNMMQFVSSVLTSTITGTGLSIMSLSEDGILSAFLAAGRSSGWYVPSARFTAKNSVGVARSTGIIIASTDEYVAPQYIGPNTINPVTATVTVRNGLYNIRLDNPSTSGGVAFSSLFDIFSSTAFHSTDRRRQIKRRASYYQISGVNNDVLYHENDPAFSRYQHIANSSSDPKARNVSILSPHSRGATQVRIHASNLSNATYQAIRGTYRIKIHMTNLLGTAETPEFNLIIP